MSDITSDIIVICPHCFDPILIEQLNCCIFRHGVVKSTGQQVDPHLSKELCEHYIRNQMIFGCGKPFRITLDPKIHTYQANICEYI